MSARVKRRKRQIIYEWFGGRCFYCQKELAFAEMTLDHFIPKAMGGTDRLSNLVSACSDCNRDKADDRPTAFMRAM